MVDEIIRTIDPEEPYQRALQAGLVIKGSDPLNCESVISDFHIGTLMPTARHYIRNHFRIPSLDPFAWRLTVAGFVERSLPLSLRDLQNMPSQSLVVTLECAGNGRSTLRQSVDGEAWGLGAVSTAEWTGVPLSDVLDRAGLKPDAHEVIFRGADRGTVGGERGVTRFERSLKLDEARESHALLAYSMNGEPLPVQHGFPLRVIVPRWYAVASVKWLTEIEVTDVAFNGYFQHDKYVYEWEDNHQPAREPVTLQRVRALITEPAPNQELEPGEMTVRGVAWSGVASIARVEVSIGGRPWEKCQLSGEPMRHSWQWWEMRTRVNRGPSVAIRARATDRAGRSQPLEPEWNRLGYGANALHEITVQVR